MISRFLPHPVRRFFGVKAPVRTPEYELLDQPGSLRPLFQALDRVDEIALDSEADNMFHYRTRLCLLQIMAGKRIFLVDVLAPGLELRELWPRLREKHLVMHGSDFDLRLLHAICDFRAKSVFDTMLAAQLLNRKRIGLAGLLEEHYGVELDKDGQKANWSKRPITKRLLDYASLDVFHLFELRDLLMRDLVRLDRADWLDQQCRAQIAAGAEGFAPPDENDWRIAQADRLHGRGLGVMHALWHWREDQARRLDTPPFKVCGNDLLMRISHAAETGESEEAVLNQINLGKRHPRLIQSLADALHSGYTCDPKSLSRRKHQRHAPLSTTELARQDALKLQRDNAAKKLSIEATLIANRAQLAQLAREPEKIHEILLPWQAELVRLKTDLPKS
jgi:ribonuclease D